MDISTAELFADLQVSFTEIVLVELLGSQTSNEQIRLEGNKEIVKAIKTILRERFTDEQIRNFLEYGYPRRIQGG